MKQVDISEIEGVFYLPSVKFEDARGSFTSFFQRNRYRELGQDPDFQTLSVATNSVAGTVRGLHFQTAPHEEEKFISCLAGEIYDVIVDLREKSNTVGNWACIRLTSSEIGTLALPQGIAHGYQTLHPNTQVLYGLTSHFSADDAHVLSYSDPTLQIEWPLPCTQISRKDEEGLHLQEAIALRARKL